MFDEIDKLFEDDVVKDVVVADETKNDVWDTGQETTIWFSPLPETVWKN
jgi:hypothetical protein